MVESKIPLGIALNRVEFKYPTSDEAFLSDISLKLPKGSRCLLLGANGTGKTTMLQIVAGKYMVDKEMVLILDRPPFHDLQLTCSGTLSYLGTSWRKDVACAGYGVPLQGDISAGKLLFGVEGVDPERRSKLIRLLDIDVYQRLNTMSDGQRRRVQICAGLLKPYEVLLCDEITVDLDVLARMRLLQFFKEESEERGATILYATHIFDGLCDWLTHVAYMEEGRMKRGGPVDSIPELVTAKEASGGSWSLLKVVEAWLREELEARLGKKKAVTTEQAEPVRPSRTPIMSNKHLAYFR